MNSPGSHPMRWLLAGFAGVVALLASASITTIVAFALRRAADRGVDDPPVPRSYVFDGRFPSPDGARVAAIAERSEGGRIARTLAIARSRNGSAWWVPYDWPRFEVDTVRWIDNTTLEISGTELERGAVRERLEWELDGTTATRTTIVCGHKREAWRK